MKRIIEYMNKSFSSIQKWVLLLTLVFVSLGSINLLALKGDYDIRQQKIIESLIHEKKATTEKTENLLLRLGQFEEKTIRLEEKLDKFSLEKQEKELRKVNKKVQ